MSEMIIGRLDLILALFCLTVFGGMMGFGIGWVWFSKRKQTPRIVDASANADSWEGITQAGVMMRREKAEIAQIEAATARMVFDLEREKKGDGDTAVGYAGDAEFLQNLIAIRDERLRRIRAVLDEQSEYLDCQDPPVSNAKDLRFFDAIRNEAGGGAVETQETTVTAVDVAGEIEFLQEAADKQARSNKNLLAIRTLRVNTAWQILESMKETDSFPDIFDAIRKALGDGILATDGLATYDQSREPAGTSDTGKGE